MRHVQDSKDTGFWKRDFVVRVDVSKQNNNQDVKIIKEDFIEQEILTPYAKVKELLLESETNKMRHVHDSQDTGFWKQDVVMRVDVP